MPDSWPAPLCSRSSGDRRQARAGESFGPNARHPLITRNHYGVTSVVVSPAARAFM